MSFPGFPLWLLSSALPGSTRTRMESSTRAKPRSQTRSSMSNFRTERCLPECGRMRAVHSTCSQSDRNIQGSSSSSARRRRAKCYKRLRRTLAGMGRRISRYRHRRWCRAKSTLITTAIRPLVPATFSPRGPPWLFASITGPSTLAYRPTMRANFRSPPRRTRGSTLACLRPAENR